MKDRTGEVWDTGDVVGLILKTEPYRVPGTPAVLHTYLRLYSKDGRDGYVFQWSEDIERPYEGTFMKRLA